VTIHPSTRDLALQVAEALENPDTWCAFFGARDVAGRMVHPLNTDAVKWCAYGHALRLGGVAAGNDLACAYWRRFQTSVQSDNDQHGRQYVRDRLLELALS
jgi:hypothetical protein